MSKTHIVLATLALVAVLAVALVFSPLGHLLPFERAQLTPRTDTSAVIQSPQTAPAMAAKPPSVDKPAAIVESLTAALAPSSSKPAERADSGPAFDVVRVGPAGDAVVAGRAAPGAVVELMREGKPLDRAVADKSGHFVMTPPQLPAGEYGLKLRAAQPGGKEELSKETVDVAVKPGREQQVVTRRPPEPSVVAAKPPAPKPQVAAVAPVVTGPLTAGAVALGRIEAAAGGKLSVEGRGTPGATIRLYLNDSYLASSKAGPDGNLKFTVDGGVRPGDYRIRLEEVDAAGVAKARAESPYTVTRTMVAAGPLANPVDVAAATPTAPAEAVTRSVAPDASTRAAAQDTARTAPQDASARAPTEPSRPQLAAAPEAQARATAPQDNPSSVVVPAIRTAVVNRGDSLWRISEDTYGSGVRYPVIYHANQQHIRNPNLIYPGQIFVLPQPGEPERRNGR